MNTLEKKVLSAIHEECGSTTLAVRGGPYDSARLLPLLTDDERYALPAALGALLRVGFIERAADTWYVSTDLGEDALEND